MRDYMTCGCGKPARYETPSGMACNKWHRCQEEETRRPKDLRKIKDKFTEIVAIRLDVFDQRKDGVWPPNTDLERWRRRYIGTPPDERPPYTIEINHFRIEVDEFVAMLMSALEETEK